MINFFDYLGDGPLWLQKISMEQERCLKSWWKNILYVNNYFGVKDVCMFQAWYLAGKSNKKRIIFKTLEINMIMIFFDV